MSESVSPQTETEESWETDSSLGTEIASSTASLSSSVLEYEYENGRRYHAYRAGKYFAPNDDLEQERMDLQHHIYLMLLGGESFNAPIGPNPKRVLDVGTGTGIWAMDFADKFPRCDVIATDLSAIQPVFVPPNLRFEIDDCEEEWLFSQPFDFIHIRTMGGSIGDWPALLKRAYDNLAPGAWIEVTDFETWCCTDDDSLPKESALEEWQQALIEASQRVGRVMLIAQHFKQLVTEAGFEDVKEDTRKVQSSQVTAILMLVTNATRYPSHLGPRARNSEKSAFTCGPP